MNNKISNIVKQTLNERYELNEKFNLILENEETSDKEKFDKIVDTLADLEDMGKSREEIDELAEGLGDWLTKFLKPGADNTSDKTGINPGVGDFGQKLGSGVSSQVREYLLSYGLGLLGFKGKLKEAFASAMVDLDLRYLIAMFRGGKNCETYAPNVIDAFAEGIATYIMVDVEGDSPIGKMLTKNVAFEYIKASQFGEAIAGVVCKVIPKR